MCTERYEFYFILKNVFACTAGADVFYLEIVFPLKRAERTRAAAQQNLFVGCTAVFGVVRTICGTHDSVVNLGRERDLLTLENFA